MKLKYQMCNPNFVLKKKFKDKLFYWAQLNNPVILC